jgi:hypothetical protein
VRYPYYAPYYAFHPRFSIGFGLYIGDPFAFPTWYAPYVPAAYGWYQPGVQYGGVSFNIQPGDATIVVDGSYVGTAGSFGPSGAPLTLPAGTHHIDIQIAGAQPVSFDINVVPGQVVPYEGTLPQGY